MRHTVETLARPRRRARRGRRARQSRAARCWPGSARPTSGRDTAGQTDMVVSPAAARVGAQAVPLRARLRSRLHAPRTCFPTSRSVYATGDRPVPPAQLRPPLPRAGARARGARQLVQRARGGAGERGWASAACCTCSAGRRLRSLGRSAEHYGLGLALGNGDVTLLELANGYRALANGGEWRPYTWRAAPPGGRAAAGPPRREPRARRRWCSTSSADPVARIPGFGIETPFDFPFPVAAKTGTSRHFTDNWAVGADRRVHRRGVGRELQRPADGWRQRRHRRGPAAPSRGARRRPALSRRARCRTPARHGRGGVRGLPALGAPARSRVPGRVRVVRRRATRPPTPAAGTTEMAR